jgi:hypothetical protein
VSHDLYTDVRERGVARGSMSMGRHVAARQTWVLSREEHGGDVGHRPPKQGPELGPIRPNSPSIAGLVPRQLAFMFALRFDRGLTDIF